MARKDAKKVDDVSGDIKKKMKEHFQKNKPTKEIPASQKPDHEDHLPKGTIKVPILGEIGVGVDNQHRYQTLCVFFASLYCAR